MLGRRVGIQAVLWINRLMYHLLQCLLVSCSCLGGHVKHMPVRCSNSSWEGVSVHWLIIYGLKDCVVILCICVLLHRLPSISKPQGVCTWLHLPSFDICRLAGMLSTCKMWSSKAAAW